MQGKAGGFAKTVLTCFEANTGALAFYDKLGFAKDASCPDPEFDGPECRGCAACSTVFQCVVGLAGGAGAF